MRRRLHRARPVAGIEHLAEGPLEVDRLGRRADDRTPLASDTALDRAEEARPSAGRGEDRVEEEGRGRLSVRARDTEDLELARGRAEEDVCCERDRSARALDDELGYRQVERALHEQGDGSSPDGLGCELVAVGGEAGNAREQGPGSGLGRLVREIRDLDGRGVDGSERPYGLAQSRKLDGGRFYQRASPPLPAHGREIVAICTLFSLFRHTVALVEAVW